MKPQVWERNLRFVDITKKLKKDGLLLREILQEEQTVEMCEMAIKQNPLAIQFASRKCLDTRLCLLAVKKDAHAFRFIPDEFIMQKMCRLAVEAVPELLNSVPEDFRTSEICMMAIKKDVSTLSYVLQEKRYELFDDKTEFNLLKKVVDYNSGWLQYMPNRSDVRQLCIECMEKDFSITQYMPEQIKKSVDVLNYQKSKGRLRFTKKYYDDIERKFKVEIKVLYEERLSEKEMYCITIGYENFDIFYDFLDGDLIDAELIDCDFDGIDLKKYNITGAVIKSEVLKKQGLYDDTYFLHLKTYIEDVGNEFGKKNEALRIEEFCYPNPNVNGEYEKLNFDHIPFFYISDIHLPHQIKRKFVNAATKEEIYFYIKDLARKMIGSVGSPPRDNSYLLIAGDTSYCFEFTVIFYKELVQLWNPKKIITVLGNHEGNNVKTYRDFFSSIGVTFLHNELLYVEDREKYGIIHEDEILKISEEEIEKQVQRSSVIVLGGIGSDELNQIYKKLLRCLYLNRVIVLSHYPKEYWNEEAYDSHWIYVNGHTHRNFFEVSDKRTIYADNQIGNESQNIGLKYFYCDNNYDVFAYYQDGVHEITKEQYIDFSRGKMIPISLVREDGTIYMLKKNNMYMFTMYCLYSSRSKYEHLYLMSGGSLKKLRRNRLQDLIFYFDNLERYADNVKQLLEKYTRGQKRIADFLKHIGGSGKIHGCIIDVERPRELGECSYCHLFINPLDGKATPYYASGVKSRIIYKDLKTLLQARCTIMAKNYSWLERESEKNIPDIQYSKRIEEWGDEESMVERENHIYKVSKIIRSLQYYTERNIVRLWNEELLDHEFVVNIKQASQIGEIVDDRLMINDENMGEEY